MPTLIGEVIGELLSFIGYDGSSFRPALTDASGRLVVIVGHDGSNYHTLKTDVDGVVITVCDGEA